MKLARALSLLVTAASIGGSGCALISKSDPVVPRYFSPEHATAAGPALAASAAAPLELRLGRVNAGAYIRDKLVFRSSAYEVGYYEERRWTEKPEAYVRRALARALFDSRGVHQVVSGAAPTLEVEMTAFEEVLGPPHIGRIQLDFTLQDDRVVRTARTVVINRPIADAKGDAAADATVAALASALDAAVQTTADAVTAELASESTAASRLHLANPGQESSR
jgi:cholesterol transport system auxiliary component